MKNAATLLLSTLLLQGASDADELASSTSGEAPVFAAVEEPSLESLIRGGLEHNADGDYAAANETWARLGELAPAHPAANVHAVDTLYWLEVHDDDGSRYDDPIMTQAEEAIRKAEVWVDKRPYDPTAHFYLGQARIQLGRLHGIRMRLYKAGSLGEAGRESLQRAMKLDPGLADAAYPLGLYQYYASFAPTFLTWIKFLWFIPTGDAEAGLANLDRTRERGDLYRFDATFFLGNIHAYHDGRRDHERALALTRQLHDAHPQNALVHFELLELLMMMGRPEEARAEAQLLEANPGTSPQVRGRANMGRVWRARADLALGSPDRAWETLLPFGDEGPDEPDWGPRWVQVTRGQILDAKGEREAAVSHYERVVALELGPDSRARELAVLGLERPFESPSPSR